MVDVTRSNFKELLPEIELAINRCNFIAIDGEFSGLSSSWRNEISAFDTPEECYAKFRTESLEFLFFQFGMSAFRYDEEKNNYTHRDYNFYVFPRPAKKGPDRRYLSQSSSIIFLSCNGFDFNKVIYEGIPYLNIPEERALRRRLSAIGNRRRSSGLDDDADSQSEIEDLTQPDVEEEDDDTGNRGFFTDKEDEEKFVCNEAKKARPPTGQKLEDAIADAVGFSTVIRLISRSGKLVVGHNMMADLCHMVHRFHTPLPRARDYAGFKTLLHSVFPCVLDTKLMCSCRPLADVVPSTALVNVLRAVRRAPFALPRAEPERPQSYCLSSAKQHEAGFDAYATGLVAIALSEHLRGSAEEPSDRPLTANSPHLADYVNRLHQPKSEDYYVDLEGDDPEPDRRGLFHVTFPERWSLTRLAAVFAPLGGLGRAERVDARSAYCELVDEDRAGEVWQLSPPPGVEIVSYEARRGRLGGRVGEPPKRPLEDSEASDDEAPDGTRQDSKRSKCELDLFSYFS